jgi:hypothetical protein
MNVLPKIDLSPGAIRISFITGKRRMQDFMNFGKFQSVIMIRDKILLTVSSPSGRKQTYENSRTPVNHGNVILHQFCHGASGGHPNASERNAQVGAEQQI